VLVLVWMQRDTVGMRMHPALLVAGALLILTGTAAAPWLPPLVRAAFTISGLALALGGVLDRARPLLPLWTLLLLSLPVIASLQFYLGYPMRWLTAWASQGLLGVAGLEVGRSGVTLTWSGRTILVDAPCSGVHTLWVGMFLNALLSHLQRAPAARFVLNTAVALGLVMLGNVLRNTALFVKEAGIVVLPAWTHVGIGLAAFLMTSIAIAAFVRRPARSAAPAADLPLRTPMHRGAVAAFVLAALAAAVAPALQSSTRERPVHRSDAAAWPETFQGRPLERVALTPVEERFAMQFPGQVARFTDGSRHLILRAIDQPTRLLHPASDCYEALGHAVQDHRVIADEDGMHWGCFTATRNARSVKVCERIFDSAGRSWTDASSWYWDALLGRSRAPWMAVAVAGAP